ncbi:kinetoplast-associated protein kap [Diplodia corticola]|uniref:Kinetoplast-associated protein kap n=1 Tax=Diplodia corticola TaxID=236234 RepID=A0A1J9QZ13_9PEZI|nr:kinetoplast-associated protein kap [Diplodia corticola]OJD33617.1 kinetoplast-associated protein kap [Diplodia corticola]
MDGLAASCARVAHLGFQLANKANSYSDAIPDADSRIKDLAKDVELTSEVFQGASTVLDDAEIKSVLNKNAETTVRTVLEACRGIFGDLDAILEHGRRNEQTWPFELHKFEMFNADLDMKNDTMRLLLLTLQLACHGMPADCADPSDDDQLQKMANLISAIEASAKRFESIRTNLISADEVSLTASSEGAMCMPDPMGSTEFTYIDDSPPSPAQPAAQCSAFSDSDNATPEDVHVEALSTEDPIHETSGLTHDLKVCIEHVQGVLHHIEEAKASGRDTAALDPTEAWDLLHAFSRTSVMLEEFIAGKRQSARQSQSSGRLRQGSLIASTGFGSYCPPCHRGMRKRWAKIERKCTEEVKELSSRIDLSVSWVRVRLQQRIRTRLCFQKLEKLPVKFVDVLGRRFNFPWKSCCSWKGMEDLVKQAFAFDVSACQYVYRGQYDLIGPDGAIILPILWATTVQPGWTVTMQISRLGLHTFDTSPSPRQRVPPFRDPWTGADIGRGRSLTRRPETSPVVIDVVEGPMGVEIVQPGETNPRPSLSMRHKSEPILQSRRTAISVPCQPGTTEGFSEMPALPILIDVSPRPRTRGKDTGRTLNRARSSMSPIPPPPPPPPPPPAAIDVGNNMAEVRVLSPDSLYSDMQTESCSNSDTGESPLGPLQACKVPSTADEAFKRWTNIFE